MHQEDRAPLLSLIDLPDCLIIYSAASTLTPLRCHLSVVQFAVAAIFDEHRGRPNDRVLQVGWVGVGTQRN